MKTSLLTRAARSSVLGAGDIQFHHREKKSFCMLKIYNFSLSNPEFCHANRERRSEAPKNDKKY